MLNRKCLAFFLVALLAIPGFVSAHCEIPCGIYDDEMKFKELSQHIDTIEKSMEEILKIEDAATPAMNQLVRWINNKDAHADKIKDEVASYFLSQRVKFPEDEAGRKPYSQQLELLHQMMVYAMKTKQTVDMENVRKLREALAAYQDLYRQIHGHEHR